MKKRNLSLWLAVSAVAMPVVVMAETTEELSSAAKSVKTTLSKLTNSSSKATVTNARVAYSKLSEEDQFSIYDVFVEKLVPLEAKFFTADVTALVTKKDTVTVAEIEQLQTTHDSKEWEFQDLVQDAAIELYDLREYVDNKPYRDAAAQFMNQLNLLTVGTITQSQYDEIMVAYESLEYVSLDYIDTSTVDAKLEELQYALYVFDAAAVQKMIDEANEENSTEETLDAIIAAYDSLAYEAQQLIVNYDKIEQLQQYVWNAPYREEAALIQTLIDSVDETVTYEALIELTDMIDASSYEAYELLQNLSKVEALVESVKKRDAAPVQEMIESINEETVTLALLELIEEQYNALYFEIQEVITNYDKLQQWYDYVWNEETLAFELDTKVWELNEESSLQEVQAVYDEYNQLSTVAKSFIMEETVAHLQAMLNLAGITEDLLAQQATQIVKTINAIWGKDQFASNWTAANDLFNNATLALQQKVTNQQKLVQYELMTTYWQEKTKLWQPEMMTVAPTKEWTVKLSNTVLNTKANLDNIKVFDENGVEQPIQITLQDVDGMKQNQLLIKKATGTYEANKHYVLVVNENLENDKNESISEGVWQYFVVK